jgi:pyruvate dehydrogenase E1 component alpha subunit
MLERWHAMARIRLAEEAIAALVETGEAGGPCHLCIGQEAIASGVCAALEAPDTVWGGHRSHGHYLARGGSLEALFAEILNRSTGCARGRGGSMHLIAQTVGILGTVPIVAATIPLAVGAAFAAQMTGTGAVAVAFFGDGALEEGSVHEALNLAGLYRLPVLFVCENNLYASHMHWSERRAADHLDRAGVFHGVPGERVDGNDVEAVYRAARAAAARARAGGGPALLECRTFRWRGHVGASFDLDVGVQRRGELAEWLPRDPLARLEKRLAVRGIQDFDGRRADVTAQVARALAAARGAPAPLASRALDFVTLAETATMGASCER